MSSADEFTSRLMGFGLTEKEAQCYFYLLRYSPKTPSPLAKALHTYREDVHRTLNSVIEKDMVRPSLNSPTVYAAVDLSVALEAALQHQGWELHEMKRRKHELQELARQHAHQPSNATSYKVLKSVKEVVGAGLPVIQGVEREVLWIAPKEGLAVASRFGIFDAVREMIGRGAECRGITDVT